MLSPDIQNEMREFLTELYGNQVQLWSMNEKVLTLLYQLVRNSSQCTNLMHWVPRSINPAKSIVKQLGKHALKAFFKSLSDNKKHYVICMKKAALDMKSHMLMAAMY